MANEGGGAKLFIGVVIIIAVTLALVGLTVRYYQQETADTTHVLRLSLKVSDGKLDTSWDRLDPVTKTYMPYVQNVSADVEVEQDVMNVLDAPKKDAPLADDFPIIWVYTVDDEEGNLVGYRNSVDYTGPGTYDMVLSMKEEPEPGDHINIHFKIVDQRLVEDPEGNLDVTEFQMFPLFDNGFDMFNSIVQYEWV